MKTALAETGLGAPRGTSVSALENGMKPRPLPPPRCPRRIGRATPPSQSWSVCPAGDPLSSPRKGIGQGSVTPLDRRGNQGPEVAGLPQQAGGKNLVHSLPFGE